MGLLLVLLLVLRSCCGNYRPDPRGLADIYSITIADGDIRIITAFVVPNCRILGFVEILDVYFIAFSSPASLLHYSISFINL